MLLLFILPGNTFISINSSHYHLKQIDRSLLFLLHKDNDFQQDITQMLFSASTSSTSDVAWPYLGDSLGTYSATSASSVDLSRPCSSR